MERLPTRVKICGITNHADAELAAELGAWALGLNFYPASPRCCAIEEARVIAARLRRRIELCGVFVNDTIERIAELTAELELTLVQLHGEEGPSFCAEIARRTGARVIKAMQVSGPWDVQAIERYHTDFHLLDARSRTPARAGLRGGTGETFEWSLLAARHSRVPLILSGGIGPDNAAEAIGAVHPYAIDSASATETAPGHKDPALMRALIAAAAGAEAAEPVVQAAPGPAA